MRRWLAVAFLSLATQRCDCSRPEDASAVVEETGKLVSIGASDGGRDYLAVVCTAEGSAICFRGYLWTCQHTDLFQHILVWYSSNAAIDYHFDPDAGPNLTGHDSECP